jgi:hypothetical protein
VYHANRKRHRALLLSSAAVNAAEVSPQKPESNEVIALFTATKNSSKN